MREEDRALLEELLLARGPGGQEDEVRAICQRELEGCCDEVGSDAAGNLVARISPPHLPREQARRAAVRLLAHLDEIAMIVKRVEADGTLRVVALGGAQPVSFGVCPVQILAGEAVLDGVLSYGSMHATGESPQGSDVLSGAVHWRDVHVVTRRSAEELANLGVRPGTRVVLNRLWRRPLYFQDCVAAHFLDDRAPLLAVLGVAREIARRRDELHGDLYLVLTTMEEESNAGALFAARRLPGDISIAVEVGPTVAEYGTRLCRDPIVNSGDSKGYYSRHITDRLLRAAETLPVPAAGGAAGGLRLGRQRAAEPRRGRAGRLHRHSDREHPRFRDRPGRGHRGLPADAGRVPRATAGRRSLTDNRRKENSMNEYLPTSTANGLPHNLQRGERLASIGAGLVLAGFGLARGGLPGACKAVAGGLLVSRGLSGHCHVKGLLNEPREELQLLREEVQHLTRRLQRLQERQRDDSRQDAALDAELPPNLP
ncbi:cellulase [Pseudomonas aeruginosa]|nr:cellulase [Pseudomonas aeruginosa]